MSDRRLIEVSLPLYEVSRLSAKQKQGLRTGQIKGLHIWWARRPTAASRAAVLATLLDAPETEEEREKLEHFLVRACTWDASVDESIMGRARKLISEQFRDQPPRVLDPFAGGGIIPLEALRLGCEAHALELNPVAHLIEFCTLVYPQLYADGVPGPAEAVDQNHQPQMGPEAEQLRMEALGSPIDDRTLASDVRRWGKWVLEQAHAEIGHFYENPVGHDVIVAYFWARTVECPNPSCGATMPLVGQFWLRRKSGKQKVALKPVVDREAKQVSFEIVRGEQISDDFDPSEGTTSRSSATCLLCGQAVEAKYLRAEGQAGRIGAVPLAVITTAGYGEGKEYRAFGPQDLAKFRAAQARLKELRLEHSGSLSLVPDEPLPLMSGTFNVPLYGLNTWGSLFNARQALAVVTLARKVKEVFEVVARETGDASYARAVATYLAFAVDRLADAATTITIWQSHLEAMGHTFGRAALPMKWDYAEVNPFSGSTGSLSGAIDRIADTAEYCSSASTRPATVKQGTATSLPYPDSTFQAIVTDPPYYNAVPYADLSDFFYVWLKRSIGGFILKSSARRSPRSRLRLPSSGVGTRSDTRTRASSSTDVG